MVHKVRNVQKCKNYALKKIVLKSKGSSREEQICKVVKNPFIVEIVDVYRARKEEKETVNILMKLYKFSLGEVLASRPEMNPLNIKIMFYQMVRAVHYLHLKGICHRDVRPDNILVDARGRLVLADFGSAKRIKDR